MTIATAEFTQGTVDGTGVFDELMRAIKAHLQEEYAKSRIKGPEYSTVYLGAMTTVMNQALQFLLQRDKADLEAQILAAQLLKIQAEVELVNAQILKMQQDQINAVKEGNLLDARTALTDQQTNSEIKNNELGGVIDLQKLKLTSDTTLTDQQGLNAVTEGQVLFAQKCKLEAEFDLIMEQKLKSISETALLSQKKLTEAAQTTGTGVDSDSVIGRQKALYVAQTGGFARDAEQKAAKLMADTWSARRMTDETGTQGNLENQLHDSFVGRAVEKLLAGIQA